MTRYLYDEHRSFIPDSILEEDDGLRPSFEYLLQLIDLTDPAWPAVAAVLREMKDAGVELDPAMVGAAVKLGRQRWDWNRNAPAPAPAAQPTLITLACASSSIVYYVRRGELIKIGTTVDPMQRFWDLLPDEICAVEPGGRHEEQMRHRQFRHLRCQGEHFRAAPELLKHIKATRRMYGVPDPSWPTSASAALASIDMMPAPESPEMLTAAEAASQFGLSYSTIRGWVNRGRLRRAGKEGGKHLYYADDLRFLAQRRRAARAA